jgi:hypothetical protein
MKMSYAAVRTLVALTLTAGPGCVSVHSGATAVPVDRAGHRLAVSATGSALKISARQLSSLGSCYFGAIEVTFENQSGKWVTVSKVGLEPAPGTHFATLQGTQLRTWLEATLQRNFLRAVYRPASTQPMDVMAFGLLPAGCAEAGGNETGGDEEAASGPDATVTAQAARNHLLAVPFSIPPHLFIKKWVVLEAGPLMGAAPVFSADLAYETADQRSERVHIVFDDPSSEWQRPCETAL